MSLIPGPLSFEALKSWCATHWGLALLRAPGHQSDHSLRPYKSGFLLRGSFPGEGYRTRWYPSLRRIAKATEFRGARAR